MAQDEVLAGIAEILGSVTDVSRTDITPETAFTDLGTSTKCLLDFKNRPDGRKHEEAVRAWHKAGHRQRAIARELNIDRSEVKQIIERVA
jgi:hypothetical protein